MSKKKDQVGKRLRKRYYQLALDLGYGEIVADEVMKAPDENSIGRILHTARDRAEGQHVYR